MKDFLVGQWTLSRTGRAASQTYHARLMWQSFSRWYVRHADWWNLDNSGTYARCIMWSMIFCIQCWLIIVGGLRVVKSHGEPLFSRVGIDLGFSTKLAVGRRIY
jgi:hypothetical protein